MVCEATIILKVDKLIKAEIERKLLRNKNVTSLYRIDNGYDFMLMTTHKGMFELEEFVERIDREFKLKSRDVYFIIEKRK